jgi:hypothetical protein
MSRTQTHIITRQLERHTICGPTKHIVFSFESDLSLMMDTSSTPEKRAAPAPSVLDAPMPPVVPESPPPSTSAAEAAAAAARDAALVAATPLSYISIPTYIYDSVSKSLAPHYPVSICPEAIGKHFPGYEYNTAHKGLKQVGAWSRGSARSGTAQSMGKGEWGSELGVRLESPVTFFPAYLYDASSARVMPYIYDLTSKSLMPVQNVASIPTAPFLPAKANPSPEAPSTSVSGTESATCPPTPGSSAPDVRDLEKAILMDVTSQPLQCCNLSFHSLADYRAHLAHHNDAHSVQS